MFSRVAELLDAAGPVVLVVDDADLLDAPSAAVLRALLSPGAVSGCCLVVGASGTTAVESVEAWPVTAASSRVSLQPLNESELAALAVDNLWALVGGHPATLVACVSAAHRDGVLSPAEIARVVHQVGDLGDLGRAALVVLARSGRPTRSTDLAHALHVSQSTAADLLRRAVQLGVARGTVRYGHELVGDVLAEVLRADSAVHPH